MGTSNIPVGPATKRKIAEEGVKTNKTKRTAFGDITNAASKTNQDGGKQGIKDQVKKGLNSFVEKGKTSLRSSLRRKNAKKEENTSSSSEEALMCVIDSSESSTEVT